MIARSSEFVKCPQKVSIGLEHSREVFFICVSLSFITFSLLWLTYTGLKMIIRSHSVMKKNRLRSTLQIYKNGIQSNFYHHV